MAFGINFTQLILYGGAAVAIYYLYTNKLPPFDKLELPSFGSEEPKIEATDDATTPGMSPTPDVVPGKEGVVADFLNPEPGYAPGGGTSGSLEDDFFITLARQKALLDAHGGGSNTVKEAGDAPLYQHNPALGTNYNNITFDKYGNTVVVPIPQTAKDVVTCKNQCMVQCGNMYNKDPAMKESCISACERVCSTHYSPPTSYPFPPYFPAYAGKKLGWRKGKMKGLKKPFKGKGYAYGRNKILRSNKTYVSRYADKINATMPPDEIVGVWHNENKVNVKSQIQAKMMLRPMHSSRNMLKLTCGQSEVCNV